MIVSKNVELAGIKLKKWYSNNLKKIKCNEDNNIYSAAYTSRDANLSFEETNLPLNEITSGAIISVDDVWGLSDVYAQKTELSGYATIQSVEDLSSEISTKSTIFVQGEYSSSLSVANVTYEEYVDLLEDGIPPNCIYVLSSDINDQMGERIANLGEAIISGDAMPMWQIQRDFALKESLSDVLSDISDIKTDISDIKSDISSKSTIYVQGEYSSSLSVSNVSEEEYYNVLSSGPVPPNSLYVISSNVNDQMGEKITNLGEASDLSDAMPMWQIKRDFISKESLSAALSGLNESSTIGQMLNALTSLTVIK